jgi:hypothetical protein
MSLASFLVGVLLLSGAQRASQQSHADTSPAAELESVLVEGRRLELEEAARAYAQEVGEPPRGTRLARWNRPVCVSVSNMQPRYAQFMIDRIAMNALDAGADVGGPGCRHNVIILATTDGPALAKKLVRDAGLGFRPAIQHTNLTRNALSEFQNAAQPVRWWNVVMPVTTDTGDIATVLQGDSVRDPSSNRVRFLTVRDGSRIRSNIRYDMAWTIVIVDMSKTGGAPFGVLADYVSMVSLAQIDPDADLSGQSTVMNLFLSPAEVDGLSQWDKDYLAALYTAPNDRVSASQQENGVVRSMLRERQQREGEATPVSVLPANEAP